MILNRGVQEPKIKIEITLCRDWTEPNASQKEKKKKKNKVLLLIVSLLLLTLFFLTIFPNNPLDGNLMKMCFFFFT